MEYFGLTQTAKEDIIMSVEKYIEPYVFEKKG